MHAYLYVVGTQVDAGQDHPEFAIWPRGEFLFVCLRLSLTRAPSIQHIRANTHAERYTLARAYPNYMTAKLNHSDLNPIT